MELLLENGADVSICDEVQYSLYIYTSERLLELSVGFHCYPKVDHKLVNWLVVR